MGAWGLEWFLWTYCKAVAVVLFCAEPRELRLRVTDSSPCRHMSGPSLTREGELFELNVAVGEQEVISLGPVPRRFPPPLLMGYAKEKKSRLSLCFLAGRWMIRGVHSRKDWLCQGRMAKQGREAGLPSLRLRQGKRKSVHARSAGKRNRLGQGARFLVLFCASKKDEQRASSPKFEKKKSSQKTLSVVTTPLQDYLSRERRSAMS